MVIAPGKGDDLDMETPQLSRVDGVEQVAGQSVPQVPAASPGDLAAAFALAHREAWQLPVLRQGRAPRRRPETWEGVVLRLQAALWEVAARGDIPVTSGASVDAVARLLVGYGAIIPPAGDAVRAVAAVAQATCTARAPAGWPRGGVTTHEAARLAERLAGYLALRARFG